MFDQQAIDEYCGEGGQDGFDADLPLACFRFDEGEAVVDDVAQFAGRPLWFATADEIMHAADDAAGALGLGGDFFQGGAQFGAGEVFCGQQVKAAGVVAGNGSQRLVQFVRQGGGHFAQGH